VTPGYASAAPAVAHVFVDKVDGDADLSVDGDDGHHLQRVRRLRAGEAVTASDGQGRWRLCTVAEVGEGRLRLAPIEPVVHEPALSPSVVVAFAPAKGDQAGAVVHQLVELGVDAVMPITLHRSVVRRDGERGERARERLARVIREAAMQSRRSRIPELLAAVPLAEIARHPGLLVAGLTGAPAHSLPAPDGGEWLVVVGPEGGLDPEEVELLGGGTTLGVGPYVLRAVTAPVAVAAALVGSRAGQAPDASDFGSVGGSK
jgi:16S rRNA (uracil1498-N3)-methyltransferase